MPDTSNNSTNSKLANGKQVSQPRKRRSPKKRKVLIPVIEKTSSVENDSGGSGESACSSTNSTISVAIATDLTSKSIDFLMKF